MFSFLSASEFTLAACAVTALTTLVFSTKIKDWFSGVPADLRAGLTAVETKVKADVKAYQADLIAKVTPASKVVAPVAPPAPAAPVAPVAAAVKAA